MAPPGTPSTGKWFLFRLDGAPVDPNTPVSLEQATERFLKGAKVESANSAPDDQEVKWTSWRFDNGVDLRYEGDRITLWVPDSLAKACPTCKRPH